MYTRKLVDIKLLNDTSGKYIKAICYVGDKENPNFKVFSMENSSNIISKAKGPSGKNSDYLLNLNEYLINNNMKDEYINELSKLVNKKIKNTSKI